MERHVFPHVGSRPVSEVDPADLLELLALTWYVKEKTGRAVRQRIRSVLEWAIAMDIRNDKPRDRAPLCRRAIEILDATVAVADGCGVVSPMRSGRPVAPSTLPKMLQHHTIAAVAHGFRSLFRDWAAEETDHSRDLI